VLTHHAPTVEGTNNPKYNGGSTNSAFATEMSAQAEIWVPPVIVWAFGHPHWSYDFEWHGVRPVSKQRGYKKGGSGFDPAKVLQL